MFRHMVLFEVKYRLQRVSTYVYFAIWFFMAFFAMNVRQFGPGSLGGRVFVNSPFTLAGIASDFTVFGAVVIAAIFGTAIYRDFEEDTYQLFFTTPLKKRDYLGGRFVGSFIVAMLTFAGFVAGVLVGPLMPWADGARLMPINVWHAVQPYLLLTATVTFSTGALFFAVGALTRSIVYVYLQGVVFLAIYLVAMVTIQLNRDNLDTFWPAVFDPFASMTMERATRYWSVAEKNTLTVPLTDVMLWNRLLWMTIGGLSLVAAFRFFPFSAEALTARRRARRRVEPERDTVADAFTPWVRRVEPTFSRATTIAQFLNLTRLRLLSIVKEVPFAALVLLTAVLFFLTGSQIGRMFDTPVYPVTYIMTEFIRLELVIFLLVIVTIYAGELVWKERGLKYDQIHDSLPMPGWLNFASQIVSISIVQVALLVCLSVSAVAMQAFQGYFRFELDVYAKELFLVALPLLVQYTILAVFLQTVLQNKYLAHALIVGLFAGQEVVARYGFEDPMYYFADMPDYTYSDMNGFGHFVRPILWFTLYWTSFAVVLAAAAILFARRGTESHWRTRVAQARARLRFPINAAGAAALIAFAVSGSYVFYNTHRLNAFESSADGRAEQARYEKQYKQYESLPQPKITAVDLEVDIFPERRSFAATGAFTLVNKTDRPIPAIHVVDGHDSLRSVRFDRQFTETHADKDLGYFIYMLAEPLQPGHAVRMDFTVGHDSRGFKSLGEQAEFAHNGTFFGRDFFPLIGYQRDGELTDDDQRRDQGLGPVPEMPAPDAPGVRGTNLFTRDADFVTFKAVVSTSPDQIAIAPGYLQREWTENGRRYFSYDMENVRIANFYSFVSGRYQMRRDKWNGVAIEVYYHPEHPYNVDRMIDASKKGLDYFTKWFGPYQFRQFRILEFPRYRRFAQSFPNTVPYSEGIGFIARIRPDEDVDVPFYVTAHELAHQWWGHQVVGAYAQGSNMLSETLSQYSALMVMEKEVGPERVRRYLKHELDGYLRGRSRERRKEMPLARVQREGYVWYQKGSLAMYALKDYLGEERLNRALGGFLDKVRFSEAPYPTADDVVAALRDAAPDHLKSVVTDLFERITLFDNRATEATWRRTADGKYVVTLAVTSKKLYADGLGAETAAPLDDMIDIAVFTGKGTDEKALFFEKRRLTTPSARFEITVDAEPTRAGIDPYHKLVDRQPDDNLVAVTRGSE